MRKAEKDAEKMKKEAQQNVFMAFCLQFFLIFFYNFMCFFCIFEDIFHLLTFLSRRYVPGLFSFPSFRNVLHLFFPSQIYPGLSDLTLVADSHSTLSTLTLSNYTFNQFGYNSFFDNSY